MWDEPFHDGSPLYLPEPPSGLGERFDVLLRVPRSARATRVVCRQVHDGEPLTVEAVLDRRDDHADWFRARLRQHNPVVNYRFLTDTGPQRYRWITAAGQRDHDPADAGDFRTSIHPGAPPWVYDSVGYQIFPDRFARSSPDGPPAPAWARPARSWDERPAWGNPDQPRHFFGGDLAGIEQHLDHIAALGADLLYLTPVFPAPSNHRYNADTFDHVDPLLGGDAAYAALISAAHRRGMHIIGDLTTNHTGNRHSWFLRAKGDAASPEASYYHFTDHPDDYIAWFDVPSLPKLDYRSPDLVERMITGSSSPIRRYLDPPFGLDGWRVDVANMTGRQGAVDLNHEVAAAIDATMRAHHPDAYLVGEHFHDFLADLGPQGWHGIMNYAGFAKPLWQWLAAGELPMDNWLGIPWAGWPRLPATAMVATMREFAAAPWQQRRASLTLVGSHDTPRISSITGSTGLVEVAVAALMTTPGVPMVWMGDELGLAGITGEDGRRTIPWGDPSTWRAPAWQVYRDLIALRRSSPALRSGSLRWLFADADRAVFTREAPGQRLLVWLARAPGTPIRIPLAALDAGPAPAVEARYSNRSVIVANGALALPADGPGAAVWQIDTHAE